MAFYRTLITGTVFDNYWVQHHIPQSDLQYSWITASIQNTRPYPDRAETYGHAPADGKVSSSIEGIVSAYNFVSASHVSNSSGIATTFAYNTTLVEGVRIGDNLLSASFPEGYVGALGNMNVNGGENASISVPELTNALFLMRNGPYQHPTFRQVRTGEHAIARMHRKKNILSVQDIPNLLVPGLRTTQGRAFVHYTEPPVIVGQKPLEITIQRKGSTTQEKYRVSYGNGTGYFSDERLNKQLGLRYEGGNMYEQFLNSYTGESPTADLVKLEYKDIVYPKESNTFLSGTRDRLLYKYDKWNSDRASRKTTNAYNSMTQLVTNQSNWPLDARDDFLTAVGSAAGSGSGAGELQNGYTLFHEGSNLGAASVSSKSVQFNRKAFLTASNAHSIGPLGFNFLSQSVISFWFKAESSNIAYNYSASLISRGQASQSLASAPTPFMSFDIMLNGDQGIVANVGQVRGFEELDKASLYPGYGYTDQRPGILSYNTSLSDDQWHHVVLAWYYNGPLEHSMSLYVDGVRRAEGMTAKSGSAPETSYGSAVLFGANPPNNVEIYHEQEARQGFTGFMDEISFFTGSLSASLSDSYGKWNDPIVTQLYNEGNPIDVVNTSFTGLSLVSHYRMGEHTRTVGDVTVTDGPLGKPTAGAANPDAGFIHDVSSGGLTTPLTGNLSASCTNLARKGFTATNAGIVTDAPFNAGAGGNANIFGPSYSRRVPEKHVDGDELGYFAGDTLWEAPAQSGKNPFYNSYNEYKENCRPFSKDYTIIPEFRMSEHIEEYVLNQGGNFLAKNENWLQLTGAADSINSSDKTNFFETYSNTQFMKLFDVLKRDHIVSGHKVSDIELNCKAIIKFLPYEGFYPAVRTTQLANLFSSSYAENVGFKSPTARIMGGSFGSQTSFRTFITPLFSPGILYNSIKSGIAVDHPIMTSSFSVNGGDLYNDITGSHRISSSFGLRLPFESIVEPEKHLAGITVVDYEPHPSASMDSTSSWDGGGKPLYRMAMHNFTSEVPRFFLEHEGVSSFVSARDDNRKYYKAQEGLEYRMRVVMRNGLVARKGVLTSNAPTDNSEGQSLATSGSEFTQPQITMYDRRSAFGPPVSADYIKYNESYAPFTPPYMDGYAEVELSFTPDESRFYFVDEIVGSLSSSYYRVGEQYFDSSPTSAAQSNKMNISASLNILDVFQIKKAVYNPETRRVVSVEDDSAAASVATIQMKWETPILDFSDVSITLPTFGSGSVSKGMWHQYGSEPAAEKGVYLEVQNIPDSEKTKPSLTGSLVDLMGFSTEPMKLGQVAKERVIREAIVAIPYIVESGRKRFFNIPRSVVNSAAAYMRSGERTPETPGNSILQMVAAMEKYVLPPKLDFYTNEEISPFSMYIFEFEYTLDKQDLIDIWQNLSPDIGRNFELKESKIKHSLVAGELLEEINDSLKWMVFKVKQRASYSYDDMLKKSVQEEGFTFTPIRRGASSREADPLNYSYNWPYDYFSLIEAAQMNTSIDVKPLPESPMAEPPLGPSDPDLDREIIEAIQVPIVGARSEDARVTAPRTAVPIVPDTSTLEAEDPDDVLTGTGRTDIPTPGGGGFGGGFGGSGY